MTVVDDFDFQRWMMDEATEKLNLYVRALVRAKKGRQSQAFCEEKYAHIALTGFIKRIIAALISQNADKNAEVASEKMYETVRNWLSGKMKVVNTLENIEIHTGEGVTLKLQRGDSGNCTVAVCVPGNKKISDDCAADPDMPDGKEEAEPLMFAVDRLKAFCRAAEYIFDNAHEFKQWAKHECWQLWEKYKYLDYPKEDVYEKVPVYWWWAWLKNASEADLADLEFVKKLVARRGECFQYAPDALKSDRRTALNAIRDYNYAITYASEELQNDREFVMQALENKSSVFEYVKDKFKDDKNVALAAVKKDGKNLKYVSERLKNDPDVVETALADDVYYFRYASSGFRDNKAYVMQTVAGCGALLAVLSERLRADREVVLAAVTASGTALQYASDEYKNDREVVLAAVNSNGMALKYASDELRGNREIVLAAVNSNGMALEYASDELRGNREIALAAIEKGWAAFKYASDELRNNKEIALYVIGKDSKAWHSVSDHLLHDAEVISAALTAGGFAIIETLYDKVKQDIGAVFDVLEILSAHLPDIDNYGVFADGTSEYYNDFQYIEKAFCKLVEFIPVEKLKHRRELVEKICCLAVSIDGAYYDEGDYPYEYAHTRLPDSLKAYFEENDILYSDIINESIDARDAKKYHPKDYSEEISLEERLFLEAGDYYEWLAEKIRYEDGQNAFAKFLGPDGSWTNNVMERFVKSLTENWRGLFHDDERWRDKDYEVDLDKAYEEIKKRLASRMEVERAEFYYSENVKVFVNENVRFELERSCLLRILELRVNDYDTDCENGVWVAPDRLDVLCDMAEYIQDNYGAFKMKAEERAAKLLKKI